MQSRTVSGRPIKHAVDFSRVHARHKDIDVRLAHWAYWVTQRSSAWRVHPMFAQYRSHAWQWEAPEFQSTGTPGDNQALETLVSALPEKHRTAIRRVYAFPFVPVSVVRRHLGLTREGLSRMLDDSRDMLLNRIHRKIS